MERITQQKIEEICLETIAKEIGFDKKEISLDMNLKDDLEIVSLDAMNIIMSLEETFEFEADIETVLEMHKISDMVNYIHEKTK